MFVLQIMGCTSLPNRQIPSELGVKQMPGKLEGMPAEYVFCDMSGGIWGCESVTPKTPIQYVAVNHGNSTAITDAVQKVLGGVISSKDGENIASEMRDGKEKKIPEGTPIATIYFNFDSSELDAGAKIILLDVLEKINGGNVEIHGYTDNVGSEQYNDWLGLRRAEEVKDFFRVAKAKPQKIDSFGHGRCCYVVPNGTEEQRAKNRRVEIYLVD